MDERDAVTALISDLHWQIHQMRRRGIKDAAGKVRILAIAANKRLQAAPDIPTAIEAGLPGMVEKADRDDPFAACAPNLRTAPTDPLTRSDPTP